jgi:hypothetical protein
MVALREGRGIVTGVLVAEFEDQVGGTDDGRIDFGLVSEGERDYLIALWTERFAHMHVREFWFDYEED